MSKQRVIDICDLIVARGITIRWDIRARVDTVDEEMLLHLKKAGCQGIHYGIEAGSEAILKELNKGITITQAQKAFDLTRKFKMAVLAYFMVGNPNETMSDIQTTFSVIRQLKPDFLHMTILTPFPGTKIYKDGLASGVIKKDYWKAFAENPTPGFVPPHWDKFFSKDELNVILARGYKTFYLNPLYIVKRALNVRSVGDFMNKAAAGLKVLTMK